MTDRLHLFGKKVGLRICGEKTKTMTVGNQTSPPITLEGQNIEKVDKFQYLGSYLSQNGDVEVDIRARLGKAWSVFQRLQPIWKCRMMSNYVCIRPLSFQLGYMPVKRGKQLTKSTRWFVFHCRCLRSILGISWCDDITNDEVMASSEEMALHDTVANRRRRFVWSHSATPDNQTSHSGLRMDTRRWQEEGWKTKEDMARHTERRFGHIGCWLEWCER